MKDIITIQISFLSKFCIYLNGFHDLSLQNNSDFSEHLALTVPFYSLYEAVDAFQIAFLYDAQLIGHRFPSDSEHVLAEEEQVVLVYLLTDAGEAHLAIVL